MTIVDKKNRINNHCQYLLLLFMLTAGSLFFACEDGLTLTYSNDPQHRLVFSQDTVHFDTVFTSIGTSTGVIKVYNRNKEHLNISSITLAGGSESMFRVNVQGHSGIQFNDLDVRKKDSMYIFLDVVVDPNNQDNPILVKDSLVFELSNGVKQDVKLIAYGQDVLILRGKVIDKDTVFTSWRPILIYDSLRVEEGSTLKLAEGSKLYFHDKISCHVHGTLLAEGTFDEPILFRTDRLDRMFQDLPYDRIPDMWGGIRFYETSYDNRLNHVDIRGGEYGIRCDSSDMARMKLTLENSVIHNVKKNALDITVSSVLVGNSLITNAGMNCLSLMGGNVLFIHSTIANFYYWRGEIRKGYAILVQNDLDKPLARADFWNCLVTGSGKDEIMGGPAESEEEPTVFSYGFAHSLLNTSLDEDEEGYEEQVKHYTEVVWDEQKDEDGKDISKARNFRYLNADTQLYDFRLDSVSAAINIGSVQYALYYPIDLQGRVRIADEAPDAGCFEWMPGDGEEVPAE